MWIKCLPGIHRSDYFGLSSVSVIHTHKHMTGFDLEENISVQRQKNQKTNSCSIQYGWDTDKVRTVPVLCSWLLYAYAAMVWRELLMFLVYYNRRVSIKTPVQRKTSSWEQVVKSKLKCLVGARAAELVDCSGLGQGAQSCPRVPPPTQPGPESSTVIVLGELSVWCSPDASDSICAAGESAYV